MKVILHILWACLMLLVGSALSGCAISNPQFREETHGTNGLVTIRTLSIPQWSFWPATQSIAKQKASLGKTFSFGSDGIDQDSTSTNSLQFVQMAAEGFGAGLMKGVKP